MPNVLAWMRERFPPITLFTSVLLVALVASTARFMEVRHVYWLKSDVLVAIAVWCQFLLLRVLDEHKDFKDDARFHPDRVLQRGLISLKTLRVIGAIAFLATLYITLYCGDSRAFISWGVMEVWTLLMTLEFFGRGYLRRRIGLYSISHMLVLPLMVMWITSLTALPGLAVWKLLLLTTFAFINGLIYEVARKSKGREEEIPEEPTFTQSWGVNKATLALMGLMLLSFALFLILGAMALALKWFAFLPAAIMLIFSIIVMQSFSREPIKKRRKMVEGITALYVLAAYVSCISFLVTAAR